MVPRSRSNESSSSKVPWTKRIPWMSCCQTSSRNGVLACSLTASWTTSAKSSFSQSRRAKPTSEKPGGSRPRFARSYTAGMSFFRDKSPVTPKMTRPDGPAIRGSRRSAGSRSGLLLDKGSALRWGEALKLRLGRLEQVVPGRLELLDALVLQELYNLVVRDPELLDGVEFRTGLLVRTGDRVAADLTLLLGGEQGRLRHGVHRVRRDQFLDVHGLLVRRVLDAGRGPQRALLVRAGVLQLRPAVAREDLLVRLVGEARVRDAGLAAGGLGLVGAERVDALVDLGVHTGHEEGRHGVDLRQVETPLLGLLQARHEGLHDLAVALEREDQRDVDADPEADHVGDRRDAGAGGRDLDEGVGAVHQPGELLGLGDRRVLVVRQARVDLDRHAAVLAAGGVEDRAQDVGRVPDVRRGDHADGLFDRDLAGGEVGQLLVVAVALGDRLLEDRRVGGDAHDVLLVDQLGEVAGRDPLARQVVQPDRHAFLAEALECVCHGITSPTVVCERQRWAAARDSRAFAATFSPVKPNSWKRTLPS